MSRRRRRCACRFSRSRTVWIIRDAREADCPTRKRAKSARRPQPAPMPVAPDRRRFRERLLAWYRRHGRDLPWRKTERSVPHPRLGDHAAADAGRSRAAEVRRVAGKVSVARRAGDGARGGSQRDAGIRSATTSGRSACRRSRAKRSRAMAASCPPTRKHCCRSRGSAPIQLARSAASRSASAPPFSTRTSRGCCSACSSGRGDPKSHAMKRHLWAVSETLVPARHVFDFNQALMDFGAMVCVARNPKCLVCPMTKELPRLPVQPGS